MKLLQVILFIWVYNLGYSHANYENIPFKYRDWILTNGTRIPSATYMYQKKDTIILEGLNQKLIRLPVSLFSMNDRTFFSRRQNQIINFHNRKPSIDIKWGLLFWIRTFILAIIISFLITLLYKTKDALKDRYIKSLLSVFGLLFICSFNLPLSTDPAFIDSAFKPFKPKVSTRWDKNYFYVESTGIPDHDKMVGIKAWQQQVPIPQCYVGSNAWSIPLNPVLATVPTPTKTNFFKGAIAIAANGIPVFNALNNRGEDSYLIGELDQYGGHCGRADDYHYHIAPLCLDSINSSILPIAFALDGFAVYGPVEPDSVVMNALDENHGHVYKNNYHYHGTSTYPYMIGNMVGVVTKDATDQIIPQAQTKAIRPAGNPLNGAVITNLISTGVNMYTLTYTINNRPYNVNYSWNDNGDFTFEWDSPSGVSTNKYKATVCNLTTEIDNHDISYTTLSIFPNPADRQIYLKFNNPYVKEFVKKVIISDLKGQIQCAVDGFQDRLQIPAHLAGIYILHVILKDRIILKKFILL